MFLLFSVWICVTNQVNVILLGHVALQISLSTQANINGFSLDKADVPLQCCDLLNSHSEKPCSIGKHSFLFLPSISYDMQLLQVLFIA